MCMYIFYFLLYSGGDMSHVADAMTVEEAAKHGPNDMPSKYTSEFKSYRTLILFYQPYQ